MSHENEPQKATFSLQNVLDFDAINAFGNILSWILAGIAVQDFCDHGSPESSRIESLKQNVMEWNTLSPDAKNVAFTLIEAAEHCAHEAWEKYGEKYKREPNA